MSTRMRKQRARCESHSLSSVAVRLSQMFGESAGTWEHRLSGETSDYRRVARMNGVLRMLGMTDKLCELMLPVELSLGPEGCLPLPDALHLAELADTEEQLADEGFRFRLSQGTASVADAEAYLRKSAIQCARAEVARREAQRWIDEQEAGR